MRKILGMASLFILAAASLSAATVTVTKPADGETWIKGQSLTITWTRTRTMPDNVRITLRNASTLAEVKVIADPASNTGSYPWTVPADVPDGSYKVRVKVNNVAIHDDSDTFNIVAFAPTAITILDPSRGTVWREGRAHEVRWVVTGSLSGDYTITLMDPTGTNVVSTLFTNAHCCDRGTNGPKPYVPGLYRIRVKNNAANIFANTPVFTLSPDTIILTQPDRNSNWIKGRPCNVTWKKTGTVPATVKIELLGAYHQVLDTDAPDTGSYSWTVPSWMPVGQYSILLTTSVLDIYSQSQPFKIGYLPIEGDLNKTKVKK